MNKWDEYPASEAYFRARAEECPDHVLYDLAVQADADENLKREAERMLFSLPYGLDDFSMLVMKAGDGNLDVILVDEDGLLAGMRHSVPVSELEEAVQALAIRYAMFFLRYENDALVPYGSEHHLMRRSHVILGGLQDTSCLRHDPQRRRSGSWDRVGCRFQLDGSLEPSVVPSRERT